MPPNPAKVNTAKAEDALHQIATPDWWKHRIDIFDTLWEAQQRRFQEKQQPIKVKLIDGKVLETASWVSCPMDLVKRISNSLAERVIVARVNDQLWDLTRPFEEDCTLELLDWEDKEAQHVFWHSSAHVLGYALERVLDAKLSVGPPLEEGGFFYEGMTKRTVTESDYTLIEAAMQELVKEKAPYKRLEVTKEDALRIFGYTDFKTSILDSKVKDGTTCTLYRSGALIDPCRGPHITDTGRIKALGIFKNSSSYFQGKAENAVLQRVYGITFPKASMLGEWRKRQEEALKRDHRVIGKQQHLFIFNDVSSGSAFWLPHGARIYNTLIEFLRKHYLHRGFQEVITPNIYSSKLWKVSGHWDKYAANMFCTTCEKEEFAFKPMNCPGHCIMFASYPHSYKELPIRYADFGVLHRNELSGTLTGLTRVRRFQQDDAHIFCRMDQIRDEIKGALDFLSDVYGTLGFKFHFLLSTRPENKLGSDKIWDESESHLRAGLNHFCGIPESLEDPFHPGETFSFDGTPNALKKLKVLMRNSKKSDDPSMWKGPVHANAWAENPGDGAFYGPKIDITVEDALFRRHQCATIQLDFNLPNRFGLKYTLASAVEKDKYDDDAKKDKSKDKNGAESTTANPLVQSNSQTTTGTKTPYEQAVRDLGLDLGLDPNQARPVMIHRAILGSLERCIAILCEHNAGMWPFWLSPRQIMIVPISASYNNYAQEVFDALQRERFFVDVDFSPSTLDKKIRNAETSRYNFIFVVGQQELESRSINIRARGDKRLGTKSQQEVIEWLHQLADKYSMEY
ncbi:unnamed protein product [Phytomonas sp. Hart1]|nr:unnamed protein product [Phytomonas sp. Hart1]|eukprot:CCW71956.1 unnamed protein product [Phytomonas sp. isolate Hart1]